MPTYDYECTRCGHTFSAEQSMSEKPLKKCPKCGGKIEKLLPQTINLIFKGSGFYVTDYKNKDQKRPGRKSGCDCDAGRDGKTCTKSKSNGVS